VHEIEDVADAQPGRYLENDRSPRAEEQIGFVVVANGGRRKERFRPMISPDQSEMLNRFVAEQ